MSLFKEQDRIMHIPSVGDPYLMSNQQRRGKTVQGARKKTTTESAPKNTYEYGSVSMTRDRKQHLKQKAEKKKAENEAKKTKKIHVSYA